jgi:hypothetical protein
MDKRKSGVAAARMRTILYGCGGGKKCSVKKNGQAERGQAMGLCYSLDGDRSMR